MHIFGITVGIFYLFMFATIVILHYYEKKMLKESERSHSDTEKIKYVALQPNIIQQTPSIQFNYIGESIIDDISTDILITDVESEINFMKYRLGPYEFEILCKLFKNGYVVKETPYQFIGHNVYTILSNVKYFKEWPEEDFGANARNIILPESMYNETRLKQPCGHNIIIYDHGHIEEYSLHLNSDMRISMPPAEYYSLSMYVYAKDSNVDFPLNEEDKLLFELKYE